MQEKVIFTPEVKLKVKQEIVDAIARICTDDPACCQFGFCIFSKVCGKPHFAIDKLPNKKLGLKRILKNVKSRERKKNGVPLPGNQKSQRQLIKEQFYKDVEYILGEDIRQHELIRGNEKALHLVRSAQTMKEVILILERRYFEVYGKWKLPGHARLYRMYPSEPSPKVLPVTENRGALKFSATKLPGQ